MVSCQLYEWFHITTIFLSYAFTILEFLILIHFFLNWDIFSVIFMTIYLWNPGISENILFVALRYKNLAMYKKF